MTTGELRALGTPFIYFLLEGHSEQENRIGEVLERNSLGERRCLRDTTPEALARKIIHRFTPPTGVMDEASRSPWRGTSPSYQSTEGAHRAAELISKLISG